MTSIRPFYSSFLLAFAWAAVDPTYAAPSAKTLAQDCEAAKPGYCERLVNMAIHDAHPKNRAAATESVLNLIKDAPMPVSTVVRDLASGASTTIVEWPQGTLVQALETTMCQLDQSAIATIALTGPAPALRSTAVICVSDLDVVRRVAQTDKSTDVRLAAVKRLAGQPVLATIASSDSDGAVRAAAVQGISDKETLHAISAANESTTLGTLAEERITTLRALDFEKQVSAAIASGDAKTAASITQSVAASDHNVFREAQREAAKDGNTELTRLLASVGSLVDLDELIFIAAAHRQIETVKFLNSAAPLDSDLESAERWRKCEMASAADRFVALGEETGSGIVVTQNRWGNIMGMVPEYVATEYFIAQRGADVVLGKCASPLKSSGPTPDDVLICPPPEYRECFPERMRKRVN